MPIRVFISLLLVALTVSQSGCVRRRLTIRSNPPGALVYVDEQAVGVTPVSTSIIYYGPRKIQLVKDGFETKTIMQQFSPPFYQWPVIDFFAENLWPHEIRDERVVDVQLAPQRVVPSHEVLQRAEQLRQSGNQGMATPMIGGPR